MHSFGVKTLSFVAAFVAAAIVRYTPRLGNAEDMQQAPETQRAAGQLTDIGFVRVQGEDSTAFLQSMLSADLNGLEPGESVLAGWHDRSGRVLACPRVINRNDQYWLALPASATEGMLRSLQPFILRARVRLEDATPELVAVGIVADGQRYEIYGARDAMQARLDWHLSHDARALRPGEWEIADIRDGLPAITAATTGLFTAQMINLDLVGAISFDKGCYPGQEVIARTHYLGKARRRMLRFSAAASTAPPPGTELRDADDRRSGQVVRSSVFGGRGEMLVVAESGRSQLQDAAGQLWQRAPVPYPVGD